MSMHQNELRKLKIITTKDKLTMAAGLGTLGFSFLNRRKSRINTPTANKIKIPICAKFLKYQNSICFSCFQSHNADRPIPTDTISEINSWSDIGSFFCPSFLDIELPLFGD